MQLRKPRRKETLDLFTSTEMRKGGPWGLPFSYRVFSRRIMGPAKILIDPVQFRLTLDRLAHQLVEQHGDFANSALIGVQPRGVHLASRLHKRIGQILGGEGPRQGDLDITFFRDDFRRRGQPLLAAQTNLDFTVEGLRVVVVDDVLFTGRTIRAAMDALLAHGRPASMELAVLIDRRFRRELPIEAKYIGRRVDSLDRQRVRVAWSELHGGEDRVELWNPETENG